MTSRLPALAGSIALLWSLHAFGQCTKDTDCGGGQICQQGTCVSPAPAPPPVAEPSQPPARGELGARRLALKAHPLTTLGGLVYSRLVGGFTNLALPVELESSINPNMSWFGVLTPYAVTDPLGGSLTVGATIGGGTRFYLFAESPRGVQALRGFWFGGYGVLTVWPAGGGFDLQPQAGYAWVFDNGFYISVGASLSLASLFALATGHGTIPIGILVPIGFAF